METFALAERDHGRRCREIAVTGELDMAVADQLQAMIGAVGESYERIAVNLGACEFIDSTAIAVVMRARQRLQAEGRRIFLCGPRDQVLRVLQMTGITDGDLVVESFGAALAAS